MRKMSFMKLWGRSRFLSDFLHENNKGRKAICYRLNPYRGCGGQYWKQSHLSHPFPYAEFYLPFLPAFEDKPLGSVDYGIRYPPGICWGGMHVRDSHREPEAVYSCLFHSPPGWRGIFTGLLHSHTLAGESKHGNEGKVLAQGFICLR